MIESTEYLCPTHGRYPTTDSHGECQGCVVAARAAEKRARFEHTRAERWESCGVPRRYRRETLESWTPNGAEQRKIAGVIGTYAKSLRDRYDEGAGLLLLGPPGVGKTHLLAGLVRQTIATTSLTAHYASWPDVVSTLKAHFAAGRRAEAAAAIEELKQVAILAIDELALRSVREGFESDLLLEVINARYADELPLLAASNAADTGALQSAIGERAADRIRGCCTVLAIPGVSMRGRVKPADSPDWPEPAERITVTICMWGEMQQRSVSVAPTGYHHGRRAL